MSSQLNSIPSSTRMHGIRNELSRLETSRKMGEEDFIVHGPQKEEAKLDASLGQIFLTKLSEKNANHPAFVTEIDGEQQTLSCGSLLHYSKLVSLIYEEHGMKSGDTVMIAVGNTLDFAPVVYAAFFSGIACSPVNPAADTRDFLHLLSVVQPQLVLCDDQSHRCMLEAMSQSDSLVPVVTLAVLRRRLKMSASTEGFQLAKVTDFAKHVAVVMCSSGTTGRPKGVEISQEVLLLEFSRMGGKMPPNTVAMSISGPYWISGLFYHTMFVITGGTLILVKQFDEKTFLEHVVKYKVNLTSIGPDQVTAFAKWPDIEKYDLSSLKRITVGGSRPSQAMMDLAEKRLKKTIIPRYAMTECPIGFQPPFGVTNKPGTIGKITHNASAKVVDPETGKILGPNQEGELCFKTRGMLLRYRGNPEATAALFDDDGFLHSGDIAYYDDDGYFFIVDRIKDLIKYKLNHVPACDIEEVILQHPGVKDVSVVGIPHESDTEHATAFIIKAEGPTGATLTEDEITSLVEGKLPELKWLHGGVVFVDSYPRTASGKVQKRTLRASNFANLAKTNNV